MKIEFNDVSRKAELGDIVVLQGQEQEVVKCQETDVLMLNVDADELKRGDLTFIKKLGLTISNPDTDKPVALGVDFKKDTWGERLSNFFAAAAIADAVNDDDDDDSGFFSSSGSFGGSSSFGGLGGFGGFGGGSFGGGGASRGF